MSHRCLSVFRSLPLLPSSNGSAYVASKTTRALLASRFTTTSPTMVPRVAVLYQAVQAPLIDGSRKPMKAGGYKDSCADIAYTLGGRSDVQVLTPRPDPDPSTDADWSFPDTEEGILSAIDQGATHLWANTVVFASHPLQTSARIAAHEDRIRVVGHAPQAVEKYDNKELVNAMLRQVGGIPMSRAWPLDQLDSITFPAVVKPVRGRGSYGVKVCRSREELTAQIQKLADENLTAMVEEYMAGEEATVAVMPPEPDVEDGKYWALPVVTRGSHVGGVLPYNGVVPVAANSRAVAESADPAYAEAQRHCERIAELLKVKALIRIDVRRYTDAADSKFAIFDVNAKPNMTGPGRPGRDDQASLVLLAGNALGWDYSELLDRLLKTASTLKVLKSTEPVTQV